MPTYDYYCPANARTLEVRHSMSEKLSTWGELRARAGGPWRDAVGQHDSASDHGRRPDRRRQK